MGHIRGDPCSPHETRHKKKKRTSQSAFFSSRPEHLLHVLGDLGLDDVGAVEDVLVLEQVGLERLGGGATRQHREEGG